MMKTAKDLVESSKLVKAVIRQGCNYEGKRFPAVVEVPPKELQILKATLMSWEEYQQFQATEEAKKTPKVHESFDAQKKAFMEQAKLAEEGMLRAREQMLKHQEQRLKSLQDMKKATEGE